MGKTGPKAWWDAAITRFKKALDYHRIVGDEQGLAVTYSQLGRTFFQAARLRQAEKCLNNACEHFIKLGQPAGEAAALRLLADLYEQTGELQNAIRCLERVLLQATRYGVPHGEDDRRRLAHWRDQGQSQPGAIHP